jgi:hypothetical protein
MYFKETLFLLTALLSAAHGLGGIEIRNYCNYNVVFKIAFPPTSDIDAFEAGPTTLEPGEVMNGFPLPPDEGLSIKVATAALFGQISQVEYEWTAERSRIYYALSNINGDPFVDEGIALVPSDLPSDQYPTCQPVICPPGDDHCPHAHNSADDTLTMCCEDGVVLRLVLCWNYI